MQFGGSTVIGVFPPSAHWGFNKEMQTNSARGVESLVYAGTIIGATEGEPLPDYSHPKPHFQDPARTPCGMS